MNILPYILPFVVFFLLIDLFLFAAVRKQEPSRIEPLKRFLFSKGCFFFIVTLLLAVYLYFFDDRSMVFECSKETMTCVYSRSTEYDKTMRVAKIYDISRIRYTRTKRHKHRRRSTYYTIDFHTDQKLEFSMPVHFSTDHQAQNEADRFNFFLTTPLKKYLYVKEASKIPFIEMYILVALVILIAFLLISAISLGVQLLGSPSSSKQQRESFRRSQSFTDIREKENSENDVVQRSRRF